MNTEARLMSVLKAPVISERSTAEQSEHGTYVFRVRPDANKQEIKAAVEKVFQVGVAAVRSLNVRGKATRRTKFGAGRHSDWKKAYVTLKEGSSIDLESDTAATAPTPAPAKKESE